MLKSSAEYNIDFIYCKKKASQLNLCTRHKIFVLMISMLAFVFNIIRPIIFFQSRRKVYEFFLDQRIFPQSRKFSTNKKVSQSQLNFRQKQFTWSRKFSIVNRVLHTQNLYKQGSFQENLFPWSRKFSTLKDLYTVKIFSANKDWTGSVKAKFLDPLNTKSYYAKIFLTLNYCY